MAETALIDLGILFAAVAIAGLIAIRVNQSVIPFYIVAGMLLGPHVIGELDLPAILGIDLVPHGSVLALQETDFIIVAAELGIVFLLFFLGLEFNLNRLLAARDRLSRAGVIDLANFLVGLVLGWLFFSDAVAAFFIAGIVYISSSAIITKSLIDLGWIANDEADPILGILVFEDIFIAIYLAVVSALIVTGDGAYEVVQSIGIGLAFIVALLLFVYLGTEFFRRSVARANHEATVLRVVGITVLVAGAALSIEVSEAVAAFFIGMGFSETDHVARIEELLEPLRDAFAAVFFFWIGLITDPGLFLGVVWLIATAVVITSLSKFVTGYYGGRVYGLDERRSLRVGLGLTTRGEFSLIAASIALTVTDPGVQGALTPEVAEMIYAFTVGYVLSMSILGTTLMQHFRIIERVAIDRFGLGATSDSSKQL